MTYNTTRRGSEGFFDTVNREFKESREFFLDAERLDRLRAMGSVKRFFVTLWWLLKSLYFKLTPPRRILLLAGIIIALTSGSFRFEESQVTVSNDTGILGFVIILFILMLELKDKLLAHDELKAGHAVQVALMPERTPVVAGWDLWLMTRPANDVGGDLLDWTPIADGRFSVALGDVAGKGLPAALFMVKLQATLRALRPYAASLSDLGGKVNEVFYRDKIPNTFASLIYAECESSTPVVHIINAGHFLPLLLTEQGVREIPKSGPGLGIVPHASYEEQQVEMHDGELLLMYSDGLTEARNERGEFFGDQRVRAILPLVKGCTCAEAGEWLLREVDQFVAGAPVQDDLTLILLKRRP